MARRKALGKGLSALIRDANTVNEGAEQFFQCPVEDLEPNPYQPRKAFSNAELEEMAESIREKGVLTPLLVSKTDTGYQLIAGERRWRAAQKAGLERVPVVVREASPAEALELALIENIHRKDLNPVEEALAYKRLLEEVGLTQEALAKRLGRERSSVTNMLRLLNLSALIQEDLVAGRLTMGHARVLAGIKSREAQKALRDQVVKRGLSVRQLEAMARRKKAPSPPKKVPQGDFYLQSLADNLKRSLGTKVEIKKRGKAGHILIHFYSDDELDRLLGLLT